MVTNAFHKPFGREALRSRRQVRPQGRLPDGILHCPQDFQDGIVRPVIREPVITEEDAVAKIIATMTSATAQAELRLHLAPRRLHFSTDRFMEEIRETVDEMLAG